jgi:serine/threonine protein kinase
LPHGVKPLSDSALDGLRTTLDEPDLGGTRYELLDRLGRGGMGSVFRVRDKELQREVALKVMTLPAADVAAERLRAEARVLARLEHPGIVPVHDVGTLPDGRVFYVMKLVRGVRLDEHARREPELRPLLRVFERLCEAVAFAHDRGVLHRDLKPENVMVGGFGEALVMDWGVGVLGTPGYMSPEQARGEAESVDEQSDVYGLGGVLHFLLTGQPPGSEPRPRRSRGDMPRRLEAICLKALAPRKQERYPKARDLARDVGRFLEGHAVTAYREGLWERGVRVVQRNPTLASLILSYLVLRVVLILAAR